MALRDQMTFRLHGILMSRMKQLQQFSDNSLTKGSILEDTVNLTILPNTWRQYSTSFKGNFDNQYNILMKYN